jgi:chaperonin GroES
MSVKPRSPYVLVKPTGESQTAGGLYIPPEDGDRKSLTTNEVIAVPDDAYYEGEEIKLGDVVYVLPGAGSKVTVDGENYLLVKADDVVGTVTKAVV